MKKALILAYDFPPYNSIGGQRPYAWLKYFREFGLDPIVITRHWDVPINGPDDCNLPSTNTKITEEKTEYGTLVRAPFHPTLRDRLISRNDPLTTLFRKALSVWQLLTEHYFSSSDNKSTLYDAARNYLKNNDVDVIIACGEPFVLFRYANKLSAEFGTPWIGDYRDGWSTNYRWDDAKFYGLIQRSVQQRVEKKVIATAAALTTAAPSFKERISKLWNSDSSHISVIYNGYFEEKFQQKKTTPLKPKFTIAHAGTLYYFQRVETFLNGMKRFAKRNPEQEIDLVFYGLNFYPTEIERIKKAAGEIKVRFVNKLPHEKMLEELSASHLQLLLATPEKHQIYAKIFDYMGTGRPIMMVENDKGPLEEMLKDRTNAMICSSAEEVAAQLELLVSDSEKLARIKNKDDNFTRRKQTERMAEVVLGVIQTYEVSKTS
ncbi:MAG: hypothetical protein JKX84_01935 [Flavobacteriales bacterium]|nr:hypothetical protein [Flavobacteriales bacterium]